MRKRILATLICIITAAVTVFSAMTVLAVDNKVQINDDIIKNGGFEEEITDDNWRGFGTREEGKEISLVSAENEPENVHSGNYAAKLVTNGGERIYCVQRYLYDWMSECEYTLSFWYKGTAGNNDFEVVIEEWGGGKVVGNYYSGKLGSASEWTKITGTFRAVSGVEDFRIVPQVSAAGSEIYLDDVSLVVKNGPEKLFAVETDQVFYNEDYEYATVTSNLHKLYSDGDYTYDYTIKRGVMTYAKGSNIAIDGEKTELLIDITGMAKKANYVLTLTYRKEGTIIQTEKKKMCRIDRPKNLTKDGVYMVDGEPFEPVYAYHFDLNDAEDAAKAGVNVIQWTPTDGTNETLTLAELDRLDELGLKAAVVCYWGMQPAGHPVNSARIATFVSKVKNHPAVFCYMVMDEPFYNNNNYQEVEEHLYTSYKTIRTEDDYHPVYLCENYEEMFPVSAKYVDILGIDPYPGNQLWDTHVADVTKKAVAATKGEKPVYCLVQAFSWFNGTPTPEMLRTQLYQAMAGGAQAVGYYTWVPDDPSRDVDLNESRYWETMLNFHEKDQPYLYSYFGRKEYKCCDKYHGDNMWYESWSDGESLYVAVLNRGTGESTTGTVSLKGALEGDYTVSVINGGEPISITKSADSFTIEMKRFHSAIYKVDAVGETQTSVKLLSGGEEIESIAAIGDSISASAKGIENGDRIYIALYSGDEDGLQLEGIEAATCSGINAASCTINNIPENVKAVKVFVWNKNAKPIMAREL